LEVFLHFEINHKIDNQPVKPQKIAETKILQKFLPFENCHVAHLSADRQVSVTTMGRFGHDWNTRSRWYQ
jgi:hypothetical protein